MVQYNRSDVRLLCLTYKIETVIFQFAYQNGVLVQPFLMLFANISACFYPRKPIKNRTTIEDNPNLSFASKIVFTNTGLSV